jgi:hypothetical protein
MSSSLKQKVLQLIYSNFANLIILLLIALLLWRVASSRHPTTPFNTPSLPPPNLDFAMKKFTVINNMSDSFSLALTCYGDHGRQLGRHWVEPNSQTSFEFCYPVFPETTFNCTINGGSMVAYQQSYDCADNKHCMWRAYDDYTEVYSWKLNIWVRRDYDIPIWRRRCFPRPGLCVNYPKLLFTPLLLPPQGC